MTAANDAARRGPPTTGNRSDLDLVDANATAAQATGAVGPDWWITVVCNVAFNINFGDSSSVAAPADTEIFAAGMAHEFCCGKFDTHFKIMPAGNGKCSWWHSSRS